MGFFVIYKRGFSKVSLVYVSISKEFCGNVVVVTGTFKSNLKLKLLKRKHLRASCFLLLKLYFRWFCSFNFYLIVEIEGTTSVLLKHFFCQVKLILFNTIGWFNFKKGAYLADVNFDKITLFTLSFL
jgi:hypothetical protein